MDGVSISATPIFDHFGLNLTTGIELAENRTHGDIQQFHGTLAAWSNGNGFLHCAFLQRGLVGSLVDDRMEEECVKVPTKTVNFSMHSHGVHQGRRL